MGNSLRHRLINPARTIHLCDALKIWHAARITVVCSNSAQAAADPRLSARIRGALGRQLTHSASKEALAGQPCPWSPPCSLDLLFGSHGKVTSGLELPKPYVVAVWGQANDLHVEVTLFGFSSDWAEVVADALVEGLRRGLNEGDVDRVRYRAMDISDRSIVSDTGLEMIPNSPDTAFVVTLQTPLSIRSGNTDKAADFGDFVSSLTTRIQGIARWHDAALTADWASLIAEARALPHHNLDQPTSIHWKRGSTRQDRAFPVSGFGGQWLFPCPSFDLLSLLTLGQTTGAGGRTSLGFGRFRIDGLPLFPGISITSDIT